MASGKVKWFNTQKGFGFILDSSGREVFVHYSAIVGSGYKVLQQDEVVSFDLVDGGKGLKAENVRRRAAGNLS